MGEQQEKPPIIYPTDDPETVAAKKRESRRIFEALNAKHAAQRAAQSVESNKRYQAIEKTRREAAAQEAEKRQKDQDAKERKQAARDAAINQLYWSVAKRKVFFQAFLLSIPVNIVVLVILAMLLREVAGMVIFLAPVIWILFTVWWSNRFKRSIPARREKEDERDRIKKARAEAKEAREAAKYDW